MTYFISYTKDNLAWAKWVEWVLRVELSKKTMMQLYDFRSGNFREHMHKALQDGGEVVCILSKEFMRSEECMHEWANVKDMNKLVFIRIDDVIPDGLLTNQIHVDLYGVSRDTALEKLKDGINGVARPTVEPGFPGPKVDKTSVEPPFPGLNLASIAHNLPQRNPDFTGREVQLRDIQAKLQANSTVALIGMGGHGKTAIALEYAYRHMPEYELIWYFNAASETLLQSDYRTFALNNCGIADNTLDFGAVKSAVDAFLCEQTSCLLIYDNAEGYADKLYSFLPTGLRGAHILICSREPVAKVRTPLNIDIRVFTQPDAIAFIQNGLPGAREKDAKDLAEKMGYLPLALECAVAYIVENDYTIRGYLREFDAHKLNVLDTNPNDPDKTIRTVWATTFAQLEKNADNDKAKAAIQLVRLCAYCAPEYIPLQLFIDGRDKLPQPLQDCLAPDDTPTHNKVMAYLTRYKLVTLTRDHDNNDSPFLSMHNLMQVAAMDSLRGNVDWLSYCLNVVRGVVKNEFGTREDFDSFDRNVAHFSEIAQHAEILLTDDDAQKTVAWVYHELGHGYKSKGNYDTALVWYKKALAIREKMSETEHPDMASIYNSIAGVYYRKGGYDTALEWYNKDLAICEKVLGTEHLDTATTYNNIGGIYYSKDDYDTALEWFEKDCVICKKVLGTEHLDTAISYNNIGLVYDSKGDYDIALVWYKKTLAIKEKVLGTEHPSTATSYNNIASVYDSKGDYDKALELYEKALAICEKVLGTEHPDTATSYNNIGLVYLGKGDYDTALEWLEKALAINEKVLGTEHPHTVATYNNIAHVYAAKGEHQKASEWRNKAKK